MKLEEANQKHKVCKPFEIVDNSSIDDQTGVSTEWNFHVQEVVVKPKILEKILKSPSVYGYLEADLPEPKNFRKVALALDSTPITPALKLQSAIKNYLESLTTKIKF